MRTILLAGSFLVLGAGAALAQPWPGDGYGPGWDAPPPPRAWHDGPPPRAYYAPPRVRCWWKPTPWGPREVCRRTW